jgi:hypothetical protein
VCVCERERERERENRKIGSGKNKVVLENVVFWFLRVKVQFNFIGYAS